MGLTEYLKSKKVIEEARVVGVYLGENEFIKFAPRYQRGILACIKFILRMK